MSDGATCPYLLVRVGQRRFAVLAAAIRGVLEPRAATPVPRAPRWIRGVVMHGGQVVPVVSGAAWLGLEDGAAPGTLLWIERGAEWLLIELDGVGETVAGAAAAELIEVGDDRIPVIDIEAIAKEDLT